MNFSTCLSSEKIRNRSSPIESFKSDRNIRERSEQSRPIRTVEADILPRINTFVMKNVELAAIGLPICEFIQIDISRAISLSILSYFLFVTISRSEFKCIPIGNSQIMSPLTTQISRKMEEENGVTLNTNNNLSQGLQLLATIWQWRMFDHWNC
jgi:hypothetical protein